MCPVPSVSLTFDPWFVMFGAKLVRSLEDGFTTRLLVFSVCVLAGGGKSPP